MSRKIIHGFHRLIPALILATLLLMMGPWRVMPHAIAAGDWYVSPGESIQAAVDAAYATGGGTVHVAAGTYHELIALRNGVVVQGSGADVTTIDGDTLSRVVTATGVDSTAKLVGFTIANGRTATTMPLEDIANCGGGMFNNSSSPTVTNCTFSGNSAAWIGGGMLNYLSSPTVTNCTFSGNSAGGAGGAMANWTSSPTVSNCIFSGNSETRTDGCGGAMYNWQSSSVVVTNCIFSSNYAAQAGGAMGNSVASVIVTNCTFFGNSAGEGGGIANVWGSTPTVTNCILWGDTSDEIYNETSSATVNYCDVQGGYVGAGHNIDADPLFNNPVAKDFHLRPGSPCIDQGNNSAPSLPANDFEGDPRILDGDGDGIAILDMGADEAPPLANTPVGSSVKVPLNGVTTTFNNVTVEGNTSLIWSADNPVGPTPPNFYVAGRFTDIKTTATYSGSIVIGLSYSESDVIGNERDLRLYHWTGSIWDDVTTSVDTTNHIVYGRVNSLSWFFIGGEWVWVDDGGGHSAPAFPSIYIGIGAALGAGILAYLISRRLAKA